MIRYTKDGRCIRTGADYTALRHERWLLDGRCCVGGGRHPIAFSEAQFHHLPRGKSNSGRGMGGSKRNDVVEAGETRCSYHHRQVSPQPQWSKNKS